MSYIENKPYVVSADVRGLLSRWARENRISIPNDGFFEGMLKDLESTLQKYFTQVEVVPEDFLRKGLNGFVQNSSFPVVSLDRAYVNPKQANLLKFLDVTRTVDSNLNSTGLASRLREVSIERQINMIAAQFSGQVLSLIDDVIFEGKTLLQLVFSLRKRGVTVDTIYSGITIKEGKELLEQNSVRVESLLVYDQVVDEICERDFVPGTPNSGRSVINGDNAIGGVPYLLPFGKPVEWASIPADEAQDFSLFCLYQALHLWKITEILSCQNIPTAMLQKPVFGLPGSDSVSKSLQKVIINLEEGNYE